ncbi:MAG: hypothetical protein AB8F94_17695 [Saprospiraceae bacterium]
MNFIKNSFYLLSLILLVSCKSKQINNGGSQSVKVRFESEMRIKINNNGFTLTLYGVDDNIADVSASIILVKKFKADKIPFDINLPFPKDAHELIEPKVNDLNDVNYYLHMKWDNNNNSKEDKGDIVIDFNKKWPNIDLKKKETQVIYLKKL